MSTPAALKTLVFCTAYAPDSPKIMARGDSVSYYSWNIRYRIWIESIRCSPLIFDQILVVDDGSKHLPEWSDVRILGENDDLRTEDPIVLYHFAQNLGRQGVSIFPGWVRSFFFAARFASVNNFNRIIHIEADAFLVTQRAYECINSLDDGWTALWCRRFQRPESAIQVIAGSGLQIFREWAEKPVEYFSERVIENTLPFTNIIKSLIGDHYGEDHFNWVPVEVDWCTQAHPTRLGTYSSYFWWMPWFLEKFPLLRDDVQGADMVDIDNNDLSHNGMHYLSWLRSAALLTEPNTYFEIGTHTGASLSMISCDAVCVDPNFLITSDVLLKRKNTHFYQGTSDEFFEDRSLVHRMFPWGIDLAFLDGLHLFEALLRDFINTERLVNPRSIILLHDCLPFNERMAERKRRNGGDDQGCSTLSTESH